MRKPSAVLLCFLWMPLLASASSLATHPSPYLRMHADDLVQWQAWQAQAFEQARQQQKLILVSIGYFSCYWCHVMQKENFKSTDVASLLNRKLIPVMVDREMQPVVDAKLMAFAENVEGHGGWPLHVLLTPEGYPVSARVYLPKEKFLQWIKQSIELWELDKQYMSENAKAYYQQNLTKEKKQAPVSNKLLKAIDKSYRASIDAAMDELAGGFGDASKFPLPAVLSQLMSRPWAAEKSYREFIELTLDTMASSALRDHLAGGFFRYTVDPSWREPHFEKMLYDNVLLAGLYLQAYQQYKHERYWQLAEETLSFIEKTLSHPKGGYRSSLSAVGDKGVEGEYYLWSKKQLQQGLSKKDLNEAKNLPFWTSPPLIDGLYLPILNYPATLEQKKLRDIWLRQRAQRSLPIDEKRIIAWNALLLPVFARAYDISDNPEYLARLKRLRQFLQPLLSEVKSLPRALSDDLPFGEASLEDYAYLLEGLLQSQHVVPVDDAILKSLLLHSWQRFFSDAGWMAQPELLIPYGRHESIIADSVLPSPSASLLRSSMLLAKKQHNPVLNTLIVKALGMGHGTFQVNAFWYGGQLSAIESFVQ